MHVDGFRFDLASTLARELYEVDRLGRSSTSSTRPDPFAGEADRRAVGPGGRRIPGRQFPLVVERVERPLSRLCQAILERRRRPRTRAGHAALRLGRPVRVEQPPTLRQRQLYYCHDGFTLHDLVSYNDKHNEANGEGGRDGSNDNISWNCGVEGPTDNAEVLALRDG